MVVVPGRVLGSPRLKYGGNIAITPNDGAWNMNRKTFVKSALMPPWTLLRIGAAAKMDLPLLASQLKVLTDIFDKQGLKSVKAEDHPGPVMDLPQEANGELGIHRSVVDESLRKIFESYKHKGIGMFLVVLPSEDSWLFNRVKYWGEVGFGTVL